MTRALLAAVLYFALVFAAGFAMGTARAISLAPALGETAAVVMELPLMLVVSWVACRFALRRFFVAPCWKHRLTMGMAALAQLLAAEALVSVLLGGLTFQQHLALYTTAPVLLGLAAQLAFAALPLLQALGSSRNNNHSNYKQS